MIKYLNSLVFIFLSLFYSIGYSQCSFSVSNDTLLCNPGNIKLSVQGADLDRVTWSGPNIKSNNTSYKIDAEILETSKFYIQNVKVNPVNLIENGDFELGDQDFDSDYYSSCVPNRMPQGAYCIGNNSDDYWITWKACEDRTNPGPGRFYITDGAIIADEKIWCQTVPVTPNTDYSFSTYLTSVLDQENAILQFTINGVTIGENFEASPNECEWNEFFEYWNSGPEVSAEICITNQNTASEGNDFAIDDIAFNEVCISNDSVLVELVEDFDFSLNEDYKICPGKSLTLEPDRSFDPEYNLNWSTGSSDESIEIYSAGNYSLKVTNIDGCEIEKETEVIETKAPISLLPKDTFNCFAAFSNILIKPGFADWAIWDHPDGIDTTLNIYARSPGEYSVTLINGVDCSTTDRLIITDSCSTQLFISNAFTPNGDGVNDSFGPEAVDAYNYHLRIFNRFGSVIFESKDVHNKWNGERSQQGIYVYKITYDLYNPESENLITRSKVGTVTLLR